MNGSTDSVSMPNVVAIASAANYGRFAIGPLEPGIGLMLGNALRRILLSSLPGAAVTSIRIQNVYHEFSCIPNVREDVTEVVLNVKNIRLRSYSERPVRLQLVKRGGGEVRARDIDLPANVELINPDLVLATLDGDDAQLDMELTVERGRGYISFEAHEGVAIGTIPVDAIFSPIPKVNYLVQPAGPELLVPNEDGQTPIAEANLAGREQLVIEIWTDGTLEPGEALSLASQYLAQQSLPIANFNKAETVESSDLSGSVYIPPYLFEIPIEDLNLSMRTYNCLKRSNITRVGQVLRMDKKELLSLRNFGDKSFDELIEALASRNLIPPGTPLDFSAGQAAAIEEQGEQALQAADVGYPKYDEEEPEPDAFEAEPELGEHGGVEEVVDPLGVSEGSAEMSAGIYVDGEPASEGMDLTVDAAPDESTLQVGSSPDELEEQAEPKTKARSKKT